MARCCGGGATCGCLIEAGTHMSVLGSGTSQDPFILTGDVALGVSDNTVFNLTLTGLGTAASPWAIATVFATTAKLDDIPDVNAAAPSNNQVLGWDTSLGRWTPRAPTTATPGAISHDGSLSGDGSSPTPLAVLHAPGGYTETIAAGVKLSSAGINSIVRRFTNATTQAAANPAPVLNALSIRDDAPGEIEYWTGVDWRPVTNGVHQDYGSALLELSGAYVDDLPTTTMTRQVSAATDGAGVFEVISATDLATASGVVSAMFQETGGLGYKAVLNPDTNRITGTAYSLADGSLLPFVTVTGTVLATIY